MDIIKARPRRSWVYCNFSGNRQFLPDYGAATVNFAECTQRNMYIIHVSDASVNKIHLHKFYAARLTQLNASFLFCFEMGTNNGNREEQSHKSAQLQMTPGIPVLSRERSPPTPDDYTAIDASHARFRPTIAEGYLFCFSCFETFRAFTQLHVVQHYVDTRHERWHEKCLYCGGNVHMFRDFAGEEKFYHNCFRWRSGQDQ